MTDDETCPTCGEPLEPVTTGGWIDVIWFRASDNKSVRFYGVFSEFDGLRGVFGWVEYPEQIPPGLWCRRGHVGVLAGGERVVR